jgi:hypothetical protein
LGVFLAVWRAFRAQAVERLFGAVAIAAIVFLGGSLQGVALLSIVVVTLLVVLVTEHRRILRLGLHSELEA